MPSDAFDLLGLPPAFEVDHATIETAFLVRVAVIHPDLSRGDPEAARSSALLSQACRILADPEKRADVLLVRLGGPVAAQDKSLPPGFLVEMMETREEVEAAIASGDASARAARLARAELRRAEHIRTVAGLLASLPCPSAPAALRAVRVELNAWRYTERLIEQLAAP
ncbi:MAG: DnaJ domain-containing protein [Phycisphaerales bacterium]